MFALQNRICGHLFLILLAVVFQCLDVVAADAIVLHTRSRCETSEWTPPESHSKVPTPVSDRPFTIEYKTAEWDAGKTAIIICDMWDTMCCKIPADRVAEMAPRMSEVISEARQRGVLIIHAPSGSMDYYRDTPQRALCENAPIAESKFPLKWNYLNKELEPPLPIDDSDNGWEGPVEKGRPQTHQHDAIEIGAGDAIGDSKDIYYLLRQRGIENVILMGVHTNMCILGRPFGIRQLTYLGFNVVLMRDMTDSLYNPAREPKVSHYRGTELVVEHIEKYWCPTITSTDFLDKPAFRFQGDPRRHVVFLVSDDHYHADKTLPEFAQWLREEHGLHCSVLHGQGGHDLPGMANLETADVAVVFARRLGLPEKQVRALQDFVAAGKPLIGLRTASHAFTMHLKNPKNFEVPAGRAEWKDFDAEVLGGNYNGHGPNELGTEVKTVASASKHSVLAGVLPSTWHSTCSLYYVKPIAEDATLLMTGSIPNRTEPLTWIRSARDGHGKVFYTGLGHPDDFRQPAFRQLMVNAIRWAVRD
ncbi:MAG: isochorismatase family protein [Planctomycetes bacterium]|nr:isochorismatase family protein [Planctomycetota bacterium]